MSLPIRIRLTVWYSGVLLLMLIAFGAALYFSFRSSLDATIDLDLQNRLKGLTRYIQSDLPRFKRERLWHEFEESVQLRPDEMLQISDHIGWIFQSRSIQPLHLAAPPDGLAEGFRTVVLEDIPVRIRSATVYAKGEAYRVQLATALGLPYKALAGFFNAMLGWIPLLVLAASGGGYWLGRRALAPVDRIIEDARAIGHHNLSGRLMVPHTGDELQRLSETLNEMIGRLESAFQRIARFTADASHELRSPVAFIRATAEVALLQPRDAATYRAAVADMYDEARRMSELIENLLTLARADSGSARLAMGPVDVREPLRQACSQAVACARGKNICFSVHVPDAMLSVFGDASALRRLCWILIDNAIKYTPVGGSVGVQLARSGSFAVMTVRDTGIGIADEEQARIFERFYRSDKARKRDSGGTGLGLSIARWIADVHQARIEVWSKPGQGTAFTVHLARAN